MEAAAFLSELGIKVMRGGAYKPRTSPDSFQGVGARGLEWLAEAADKYNILTVSEIMDARDLPLFAPIDILQVGTRNMQNFSLLRELGRTNKPVLLKRGFMSTIEEFLCAAEYISREGNRAVILCERGVRTFDKSTRNTLDISCVALINHETKYRIIVDLSHSLGRKDIMLPIARASLACGAAGLMIETHANPSAALCDGSQSLSFKELDRLMRDLKPFLSYLADESRNTVEALALADY
jgi:3-deoxy-7-phosphoheptulonate synthase